MKTGMAQYSIKDLEYLSGIKAHTIRIWEKRYDLIKPGRTGTNIRMYSDEDLKKILNISILSRHGFKISKIARLRDEEISEKILVLSQHSHQYTDQIEALIVSMIELDDVRFNRILSAAIMKTGFEESFIHIIYPFLERIGILWQAGTINPAQEHFISHLIRQKLIVAIEGSLPNQMTHPRRFLLFLPEGELHELGLLFYHYLISRRGHKVLYLGASVPLKDIPLVLDTFHPEYLLTFFVSPPETQHVHRYLDFFKNESNRHQIFLCGQQAIQYTESLPPSVKILNNPLEFMDELKKIR